MNLAQVNAAVEAALVALGIDGARFRLKDILVEEVSLVDRAANKRRFFLVKRNQGCDMKPTPTVKQLLSASVKEGVLRQMTGALESLVPIADAVKSATVKDDVTIPEEVGSAISSIAQKVEVFLKNPTGEAVAATKSEFGQLELTSAIKEELGAVLKQALEHLVTAVNSVKGAEAVTDSEATDLPEPLAKELLGVPKLLTDVLAKFAPPPAPNHGAELAKVLTAINKEEEVALTHLSDLGSEAGDKLKVIAQVVARIAEADSPDALQAMAGQMLGVAKIAKQGGEVAEMLQQVAEVALAVADEASQEEQLKPETIAKMRQLAALMNQLVEKYPMPETGGEGQPAQAESAAAGKADPPPAEPPPAAPPADPPAEPTVSEKVLVALEAIGECLKELGGSAQKRVAESTPQPPPREPGDMSNVGSGGPPDKRNDKADSPPEMADVLKRLDAVQAEVKKLADMPEPPASRSEGTPGNDTPPNGKSRRVGGPWIM